MGTEKYVEVMQARRVHETGVLINTKECIVKYFFTYKIDILKIKVSQYQRHLCDRTNAEQKIWQYNETVCN